ncbi:MAG: helix-turn-helix transcriptional regulator [Armatimonadetes bacterium]|nr:helix-turn-helix transcriptional regulator [Armatimonadota bacterium]
MCDIIISMNNAMNVRIFKALSDPTRLRIVECLAGACCGGTAEVDEYGAVEGPTAGEVCCRITGADKITSTVSHHLHELEDAGLIKLERRGKTTVCTLRREGLESLGAHLQSLAKGERDYVSC